MLKKFMEILVSHGGSLQKERTALHDVAKEHSNILFGVAPSLPSIYFCLFSRPFHTRNHSVQRPLAWFVYDCGTRHHEVLG